LESTNINSLGCTQRTNYCENDNSKPDRSKINSFVQLLKKDHKEKKSKVGNINIKGNINHIDRQIHVENMNDNINKDYDNNNDANSKNNNFKIRLSLSPGKNYNNGNNQINKNNKDKN